MDKQYFKRMLSLFLWYLRPSFQRYLVVDKDYINTEHYSKDILADFIGEYAKTKSNKSERDILLNQSHIKILKNLGNVFSLFI